MSITEVYDPTSVLVPPAEPAENFADSLRWKAGPLLGGLDWLLEQLIGKSAIAELVEPIAGDWNGLERGAQAWGNAAGACAAIAGNYRAVATDVLGSWSGEAAEAFSARALEIADSFAQYGEGCGAMGEVTAALLELAKTTAETIAGVLGLIGDLLTRLLAEAAIPIAGWVAGAIDGAISGALLLGKFQTAYSALQRLLTAIDGIIDAVTAIRQVAYVITTLANTLSAATTLHTISLADDATGTAFGVN
ncbi:hypothetical protein [Cellulomonas sp. NPDC089187]|uniref:hypothetical protein n=1 Tax=Cellulomonas sp. NPDC089187 TaxID=3154970 RepID=UPI003421789B